MKEKLELEFISTSYGIPPINTMVIFRRIYDDGCGCFDTLHHLGIYRGDGKWEQWSEDYVSLSACEEPHMWAALDMYMLG